MSYNKLNSVINNMADINQLLKQYLEYLEIEKNRSSKTQKKKL